MPNELATPSFRAARGDDLAAVERLLLSTGLTTAGVADLFAEHATDFVVAEDPRDASAIVAVAGLEVCCDNALLRSVAVHPEWQKHGLGRALVHRLVLDAEARGLRALYLLTVTAEHYFPRFGFERTERGNVPTEISSTIEFTTACCSSATVMKRALGAAPGER